MGLKVTNNAYAVLNASITSSATTIVLVAGQGARFPTLSAGDYFYATLIDTSNNLEIVKCTARSTDTLTVVRGQDNTTARAYATNDRFELRPTAALFNEKANANEYLPLAGGTMTGPLVLQGGDGSIQRSGGNTWIMLSSNTGYNSNGVHLKLDSSTAAGAFNFFSVGTSILEMAGSGKTLVLQGGSSSSGAGIAFPATQSASTDANTLDDYEEGTWVPKCGDGTTNITTVNKAVYTKVGKLVTIELDCTVNNPNPTNNNYITNLPFPGSNGSAGNGGTGVGFNDGSIVLGVHVTSNTTTLYFWLPASNAAANLSGRRVIFSTSYTTSA
jgi:hypothetical protein